MEGFGNPVSAGNVLYLKDVSQVHLAEGEKQ
jgi:hypothetical protein